MKSQYNKVIKMFVYLENKFCFNSVGRSEISFTCLILENVKSLNYLEQNYLGKSIGNLSPDY